LTATPTKGDCAFAFAFRVDRGRFGEVVLDGLSFALAGVAPGPMGAGNWKVGLIVDERANAAQEQAITAIVSGQAGSPLASLAPLISSFLGVEKKSIRFEKDGLRRSVSIPGVLDQVLEGVPSPSVPGEPLVIDNSIHPVNKHVALARATRASCRRSEYGWTKRGGATTGTSRHSRGRVPPSFRMTPFHR
jgi:hypothetical protein